MKTEITNYLIDWFEHYKSCAEEHKSELENPGIEYDERKEHAKKMIEAQRHVKTLGKCIDFMNV